MLFIKPKMRVETGCAWKVKNKFSCYALYQTSLLVARFLTRSQLERSENPAESGATSNQKNQPLRGGNKNEEFSI